MLPSTNRKYGLDSHALPVLVCHVFITNEMSSAEEVSFEEINGSRSGWLLLLLLLLWLLLFWSPPLRVSQLMCSDEKWFRSPHLERGGGGGGGGRGVWGGGVAIKS